MSEINVPFSMLKKCLSQNGLHVKPSAVEEFKKMFLLWSKEISEKATENAKNDNRKTIFVEDLKTVDSVVVDENEVEEIEDEDINEEEIDD